MIHNFKDSLRAGHAGEERVAQLFPKWTRTDGKFADFYTEDGLLVEVKKESRKSTETPNVALELESSPGRMGAIARAATDGMFCVLYLFADDVYFLYDPKKLLAFMETNALKYKTYKIKNRTYETSVLIVPRSDLKDCEIKLEGDKLESNNESLRFQCEKLADTLRSILIGDDFSSKLNEDTINKALAEYQEWKKK